MLRSYILFISFFYYFFSHSVFANNLVRDINATGPVQPQHLVIPYGFYNENTGFAAAAVLASTGQIQPQASTLANVFASTNESYNAFISAQDFQVPFFERLFLDARMMFSQWGEFDSYQNGNPLFPDEEAGSATSDKNNFILAEGDDVFYRFKFKFVLPIGHAKDKAIHEFRTINGLLAEGYEAGGGDFNPLVSGRTTIEVEPFYRDQDFVALATGEDSSNITSGVKVALTYDNSDWFRHPTTGSITSLSVARDWGKQADSSTWTAIQFEFSKYFNLGATDNALQRVLALNFWTSDVPTADSYDIRGGEKVFHRAPLFEGSTLGGIDRQRGFAQFRFHSRSAINYAAEYRYMPAFNPFPYIPLVNRLYIPWWQVIGFTEVGTVADEYSFEELHKHMKVSLGAGIRASVSGVIIRIDSAFSEEGGEFQVFFGHTF